MQDYQAIQTDYCRAVQVQTPKDCPEIEPDPDGFGYRVRCYSFGYGFHWRPVQKGDYILYWTEDSVGFRREPKTPVRGVMTADEFKSYWTPRNPRVRGPITKTVLDLVRSAVEQQSDPAATCGIALSIMHAKEFLAEHGVVV